MSTTPEQLPAFDRLDDPGLYDDRGMVKPIATPTDEGDPGSSATPPDPNASKVEGAAENTAVVEPSPRAATDQPAPAAAKPEDKSGTAKAGDTATDQGKPPAAATKPTDQAATGEETDEALKQKYSRPEDKGPEWGIRAYRELRKTIAPIEARLIRINSTERVGRGLDFVADFGTPDVDIAAAVDKMTALSSSRTRELGNYFYENFLDHYPDNVATDLIGEMDQQGNPVRVTAAELKEAYKLARSGATGSNTQPQSATAAGAATAIEPTKPAEMSEDDWENFKVDYPQAYEAMKKQASATPAPAAPEKPEDPKVAELTNKLTKIERQELERQQTAEREEILGKGNEFHEQAFSVVEDGLRDLGLVPDPAKDDERTIRLKEETAKTIRSAVETELDGPDGPNGPMDWSLCNEQQKENRKLAMQIMKLLSEKDYTAAFDYLELAKVRYQLAFDRAAAPRVELFNAAMGQPSNQTRNVEQEGHKRPEILEGGTSAGSNGKSDTPWLEPGFRKPGESSWDAMDRYIETHGVPVHQ